MFDGLPAPFDMRDVFTPADLSRFCAGAGLDIETLTAAVYRMGTLAKQIRRLAGSSVPARALAYPIELALVGLDGIGNGIGSATGSDNGSRSAVPLSSALLLVARRAAGSTRRVAIDPAPQHRRPARRATEHRRQRGGVRSDAANESD